MREHNLKRYSRATNGTDSASGRTGVLRRHFLQGLGVIGVAAALSPRQLFAQVPGEEREWRDLVNMFICTVAERSQAEAMVTQLNRTPVYFQSRQGQELHLSYASNYIFVGSNIDPRRVVCDNGFQVMQLPFYDRGCPCRGVNDLNASEIYRITDPRERERFGCVLVPDSARTQLDYNDHAHYVGRAADDYQLNVNDWYVPYKRRLIGPRRSHTGYQFVHRTQRNVHGKPLTDFIVSGDI